MPETLEEKIAKSTGEDTEKYANELEGEADDLINKIYKSGEYKEDGDKDNKGGDADEGDDTDGDSGNGEGTGQDEESEQVHSDKEPKDIEDNKDSPEKDEQEEETVETLRAQLEKSQKQVKDNKGEFTRRSQDLSEANKRSEHLEQNVFDLKNQLADIKNQLDQKVTAKTEKEVTKSTVDISDKLKAITEVDPDLAKAIAPVIEDLVSQVSTLKTEISVNSEKATKTANELIEDAHFRKIDDAHPGWEDMMKTEEFKDYINKLSPRQKKLALRDIQSGAAEDIIEVFSDFASTQNTEDNDSVADKKKAKVEKASKITNPKLNKSKDINVKSQRFKFTQSEIVAMTPDEFAKSEKEIDEAMAAGAIDRAN